MTQQQDEVLAAAFELDDQITAIMARFREKGLNPEAIACSLIGTAARASLEASGAEATARRLRGAADQVATLPETEAGEDATAGESAGPPSHHDAAAAISAAIADATARLAADGFDDEDLAGAVLGVAAGMVQQSWGAAATCRELKALADRIALTSQPAAGRA